MRLVHYKPQTLNNFDRLLFNPFESFRSVQSQNNAIPIDVIEETESFVVIADLPGFEKDEITIEANHEYIEITASVVSETSESMNENSEKTEEIEAKENYIRRERYSKNVSRRISFKTPINATEATVAYEDGVLTITLPKAEEAKTIKLQI